MIALSLIFAIGMIGSFVTLTEIANAYETSTDIANHIGRNDPGYAPIPGVNHGSVCPTASC